MDIHTQIHNLVYVSFSTCGVGRFLALHSPSLQEERSCWSASISCQAFLSPCTVSSQVFLGRPGPLVRGTLMDLHLLIQPLLRSTCPYQLRQFALNMFSSGAMLNFSISSCLLTSWLGLVLYIQWSMALSFRTSLAVVSLVGAQVSLPCSMTLLTQLLKTLPLIFSGRALLVSRGSSCLNSPQAPFFWL